MVRATIDRVVMLGFEVRVELTNAATGGPFIAQITRGDAEALGIEGRATPSTCAPPGSRRSPTEQRRTRGRRGPGTLTSAQ